MNSFSSDRSSVFSKLKTVRRQKKKGMDIPFIETLVGKYSGVFILEGFWPNMEDLCNDKEGDWEYKEDDFYNMCVKDNEIIFK